MASLCIDWTKNWLVNQHTMGTSGHLLCPRSPCLPSWRMHLCSRSTFFQLIACHQLTSWNSSGTGYVNYVSLSLIFQDLWHFVILKDSWRVRQLQLFSSLCEFDALSDAANLICSWKASAAWLRTSTLRPHALLVSQNLLCGVRKIVLNAWLGQNKFV